MLEPFDCSQNLEGLINTVSGSADYLSPRYAAASNILQAFEEPVCLGTNTVGFPLDIIH
jgi:hypothetical protein